MSINYHYFKGLNMSITAKAYQLVAFSGFNVTPQISDKSLEDWYNTCVAQGVPTSILDGIAVTNLNVPSVNSIEGLSPIGGGYYCSKSEILFFDGCKNINNVETGLLCLPAFHESFVDIKSPSDVILAASIISKEVTAAFLSGADRVVFTDSLLFSCVSSYKSYRLDMSEFNIRDEVITFPYHSLGRSVVGSITLDQTGSGVLLNPDRSVKCNDSLGKDIHDLFMSAPRNVIFLGGIQSSVVTKALASDKVIYGRSLKVIGDKADSVGDGDTYFVHELENILSSKESLDAFECAVRDRTYKHVITSNVSFVEEILTPVLIKFGSSFVKKHIVSILAGFELPLLCALCKVKGAVKSVSVLHMSFSIDDGFACERDPYSSCSCLDGYSGKIVVLDTLSFLERDARDFIDGYMKSLKETGDADKYYSLKKDKKIPGVQEDVCRSISEGKVSFHDALRAFK
jgi:hypothetical protein